MSYSDSVKACLSLLFGLTDEICFTTVSICLSLLLQDRLQEKKHFIHFKDVYLAYIGFWGIFIKKTSTTVQILKKAREQKD